MAVRGSLVTIVCRSIDPPLRRVLAQYLIEIAPLTFCGRVNARVREALWHELSPMGHEMTMMYSSPSNEQGMEVITNSQSEGYVTDAEGLTLGVRRYGHIPQFRRILGKTLPREYPLVCHLLDTAAVASVVWDKVMSPQQRKTIASGLGLEGTSIAKQVVLFAAGMHDIGKANPHWQRRTLKTPSNHDSLLDEVTGEYLWLPENEFVEAGAEHQHNGAVFFSPYNGEIGTRLRSRPLRDVLSQCTQAHHGVFESLIPGEVLRRKVQFTSPESWREMQKEIEVVILDTLEISAESLESVTRWNEPALVLIAGIVVLADWIASREGFIQNLESFDLPAAHYQKSLHIAHQFVAHFGLDKHPWKENLSWETMFPGFTTPNALQASIIDAIESKKVAGTGLMMLSAPMGAGKTETSLYAAAMLGKQVGANGIWVNLPTQTTSDAMFKRAVEVAPRIFDGNEHSVSLLHANSSISQAIEGFSKKGGFVAENAISKNEQVETEQGCENNSNLFISQFLVEKRLGGLSHISVGTVDQMLRATLRLKHNQLRWLGVTGNVVLIDEIHDFDAYTFGLIRKHIAWCGAYGIPVIAISATLSGESQRELVRAYWGQADISPRRLQGYLESIPDAGIPSPAWFFASDTPSEIVHSAPIPSPVYPHYIFNQSSPDSFIQGVEEIVRSNPKAQKLVVCNTVSQAVETYEELQSRGEDVLLLHSRMSQARKMEIISRMLDKSGKPRVNSPPRVPYTLVSTQIVQQSMDIDFDVLVTPLCPLNDLLQRVGRVHRHEQRGLRAEAYENAPQVHVLLPPSLVQSLNEGVVPNSRTLNGLLPYSPWSMLSTLEILNRISNGESKFVWDAKGSMTETFEAYANLLSEVKAGVSAGVLIASFSEEKGKVQFLEQSSANEVISIIPPNSGSGLKGLTSTFTAQSKSKHAPATRLIEESLNVLLLWKRGEHWYVNPQKTKRIETVRTIENMRLVGMHTISVPGYYGNYELQPLLHEGSLSALPEHIMAVDAEKIPAELGFSEETGLIKVEPGKSTWL